MELPQNTGCSSWCYADVSICRWHIRAVHEMGAGLSQNINVNLLFQLQNDAGLDLLRDLLWNVAKIHSYLRIMDVGRRHLGTSEGIFLFSKEALNQFCCVGVTGAVTGPFRPGVWKTGPWRPHSNLGFPTPGCFLPGEDRKPCWTVVLEEGSGQASQYSLQQTHLMICLLPPQWCHFMTWLPSYLWVGFFLLEAMIAVFVSTVLARTSATACKCWSTLFTVS